MFVPYPAPRIPRDHTRVCCLVSREYARFCGGRFYLIRFPLTATWDSYLVLCGGLGIVIRKELQTRHMRTRFARRSAKEFRSVSCTRSEEHTSELQSRGHLVCRLLLEKKK